MILNIQNMNKLTETSFVNKIIKVYFIGKTEDKYGKFT